MADIERLTSVGTKVTIGGHQLIGATSTDAFGGDNNMIDASTLLDEMDVKVLGRQSVDSWKVNYIYNDKDEDGDFSAMETLCDKATHPVEVVLVSGAKFTNTAYIANYAQGVEDNSTLKAVVTCALQGKWKYTKA